jgi:hypothetical protein
MTLANLSILKTDKVRAIRFSTLNAICGALPCQPGDILRFEPDANASPRPKRRILQLRKNSQKDRFNGVELSESVPARDWNSPEEDAAWANL